MIKVLYLSLILYVEVSLSEPSTQQKKKITEKEEVSNVKTLCVPYPFSRNVKSFKKSDI